MAVIIPFRWVSLYGIKYAVASSTPRSSKWSLSLFGQFDKMKLVACTYFTNEPVKLTVQIVGAAVRQIKVYQEVYCSHLTNH